MPLIESEYQVQSSSRTTNMVVIDDMNENIPPEFESITNGDYINDMNVNKAILKVNDTFKDWNKVDVIVNQHARQTGFVAIKICKDLDDNVEDITLHHDATTTKTKCLWQASFYFGKYAATIHFSKFNNVHNHQCDPVTIELAPKNQRFLQVMLDKIEHYTVNGHLSAEQHNKNPDFIVKTQLEGLSNELTELFWMTTKTNRYEMAISLFVDIDSNFKTKILAQALIKYETLADYKWILQCTLEATSNLSPVVLFTDGDLAMLENVKKKLKKAKSKLRGEIINNFIEDFYHMRNSYTQCQFESRYKEMLTKYEPCQAYLENKLYPSRESWARYSIGKIFTAGVESTQQVESINGVLKKHLDRSTLLKKLVKEVERELNKEAHYSRLNNYYGSNPSIGLPSTYKTIFKDIDSILKECLMPIYCHFREHK
ncbi:protein FAR1-RELATED SEQUENCE 5-like [Rhizophagus irregularis DAOM 181602=DAOM 197198]|nr:protein FAR1-RELATED SEQUENCE 5-like [Rhizophagus irregularis DAOM 181602=DAOM 197198]